MSRFKRGYPGRPYIRQGPSPAPAAPQIPSRPEPFVARNPAPARARVGPLANACAAGRAGVLLAITPAITLEQASPQFRARLKSAARVGSQGAASAGIASRIVTPPLVRGPSMPPMTWMGGPGFRPVPQRARLGSNLTAGDGISSGNVTPQGAPSRPRPFVARSPAPARARIGPQANACAAGVPSANVTPLGRPSSPPARPVIQHLPPHRAKVGPGTYLATGRPGVQTPLGFQAQPPPRPVIARVPPARARLGLHGQAAGGVPSAVITPLGSPSQPAPRPVIQHLPAHRAVWRGAAVTPAVVTAGQLKPFVFRAPAPGRARLGSRSQGAAGYASTISTPQGSPSNPLPRPVIQHLPPHRGIGKGVASRAVTPQGTAAPPRPFIARKPGARASLGPRGTIAGGIASRNVTPQGQVPPPRKAQTFPPRNARARTGPAGRPGAGIYGPPNAAQFASLYRRPAPQIRRPVPARAWAGPAATSGGIASGNVTPQGYAPPAISTVIGKAYTTRARIGRGQVSGGITVAAVTPAAPQPYKRPAPQIRRPAPARARVGPAASSAGGASGANAIPYAVYRIWPSTPGPAADAGDPTTYSMGVQFTLSTNAVFTGIWYWAATNLAPVSGALFTVAGNTQVPGTSVTFTPGGAGVWIKGPATGAPVTLTAGTAYKAVVFYNGGFTWYSATPHYWDTGPGASGIVSGIITAPNNAGGDGGQDTYSTATSLAYPSSSFNATNYWVDVEVQTGTPPSPGVAAYQRPAPSIRRPAAPRASLGPRSGTAAGVSGLFNPAPLGPGAQAYQRPPVQIRRPAPARGIAGPRGAAAAGQPGRGPLGYPQPTVPAISPRSLPLPLTRALWRGQPGPAPAAAGAQPYQRPQPRTIQRPAPARAAWHGYASRNITPLGTLGPPRPFIARKPGSRAVTGRGGIAGGIASRAVTPSGAPSNPLPRPVIVHLPPHRVLWRGLASRNITVQGIAGPPHPSVFRSPLPARGRSGNRGALAGGVASAVSTPQGAPSSPAPRPVIQHLPPRRVLWHGLASTVSTPRGSLAPSRKIQTFPPKTTRARIGAGTVSGGIASSIVTPAVQAFTTTYQRTAPQVRRPAPARAIIGRGGCASGLASKIVTPPGGSPSSPPARAVIQHLPGHRAVWRGYAAVAALITTYQAHPFVFRPPLPARARLGSNLAAGDGFASTNITRQGAAAGPRPFVFRSPAPARARLGPHATASSGIAVAAITPQGTTGPPRPSVARSPAPSRGKTGPRGTVSGGIASQTVTPLGSPAPRRKVQTFPPKVTRARIGAGTAAGGIASRAVTPPGAGSGPGTVIAADAITCTVAARDWPVMTTAARDWPVMTVTAHDYEP